MLTQNSLALEAQLEERPLAKKQEELQEVSAQEAKTGDTPTPSANEQDPPSSSENDDTPKPEKAVRKALLKNDDHELERIGIVRPSECPRSHPSTDALGSFWRKYTGDFSAPMITGKGGLWCRSARPAHQ